MFNSVGALAESSCKSCLKVEPRRPPLLYSTVHGENPIKIILWSETKAYIRDELSPTFVGITRRLHSNLFRMSFANSIFIRHIIFSNPHSVYLNRLESPHYKIRNSRYCALWKITGPELRPRSKWKKLLRRKSGSTVKRKHVSKRLALTFRGRGRKVYEGSCVYSIVCIEGKIMAIEMIISRFICL